MSQHELNNTVFSFFGVPGSGKGTLAVQCEDELGFVVLSTGNLCRKHIAEGTEIGKKVETIINAGHLIPDELATTMVKEWLNETLKLGKPVILDGYPRTASQYKLFKSLHESAGYNFKFRVIFFEISDDDVVRRLGNRLVCSNESCQSIYSAKYYPPKQEGICDNCGGNLTQREDDKESVIRERLKVFERHKQEILEYCDSIGQKVEYINVAGKSIEAVFDNFKRML